MSWGNIFTSHERRLINNYSGLLQLLFWLNALHSKQLHLNFQFALLVLHLGSKDNQFSNVLEMDEVVLPFEWHSFCIAINIGKKEAKVFHNGHIQAIQKFEELETETAERSKFMTSGHLGGAKFVGKVIDFEVFGRHLPDKDLLHWTLCKNKVHLHYICIWF